MNTYSKKTYFAPIAEIVIIDQNDNLLQEEFWITSVQEADPGVSADAKPAEFFNPIWDEDNN